MERFKTSKSTVNLERNFTQDSLNTRVMPRKKKGNKKKKDRELKGRNDRPINTI
jgi:hypothetical protein